MTREAPWRTGVTFAATLAISYTVCSLAYGLMPERGIDFLNALFHGLDFRRLVSPAPFTFAMFVYPLLVFVAWGFLVGTLFAWLHDMLRHRDSRT